jgi:hypothetical protein
MEYFTQEEIDESAKVIAQPYSSDSPYLKHFKSIQAKLSRFVIEHVAKSFPEEDLIISRRERINKQAGRGADHNKFTDYILVGASPGSEELGKTLFIKFEIKHEESGTYFKTELDVDFASSQSKASEPLSNYVLKVRKQTLIPFAEIEPLGYDGLLKRIRPETVANLKLSLWTTRYRQDLQYR